ncbi:MAG: J domain-containing protein [Actinobacteria bacterium]|nr:MAG: J domain-containing protein [Actinomycetota bacterium]
MLLAELNIRHTRRHMPTRRVALGDVYLPTAGPAFGASLLAAVVSEHLLELDEDQQELVPKLLRDARKGLTVPRIAMRYRLQTDTHGLDRSRHRIVDETFGGDRRRVILELDKHSRPDPQLIGAIMAIATMPPGAREIGLRAIERVLRSPGQLPEGMTVRRMYEGIPGARPPLAGSFTPVGGPDDVTRSWEGIPAERRWAMEVLGLRAGMALEHDDVQHRFRRLVRLAHPDHGAVRDGAAERIAELADARALLLTVIATHSRSANEPTSMTAERAG